MWCIIWQTHQNHQHQHSGDKRGYLCILPHLLTTLKHGGGSVMVWGCFVHVDILPHTSEPSLPGLIKCFTVDHNRGRDSGSEAGQPRGSPSLRGWHKQTDVGFEVTFLRCLQKNSPVESETNNSPNWSRTKKIKHFRIADWLALQKNLLSIKCGCWFLTKMCFWWCKPFGTNVQKRKTF